jgi:site-specific DNA-cytosine methylase
MPFDSPRAAVDFFQLKTPSYAVQRARRGKSRLEEYCGDDSTKCSELQELIGKYSSLNHSAKSELLHKLNELYDEVGSRSIHSSSAPQVGNDYDSDVVLVSHTPTHKTIIAGDVESECRLYLGDAHRKAMHERLRLKDWWYDPDDHSGETFQGPVSWAEHQRLHSTPYNAVYPAASSEHKYNLRSTPSRDSPLLHSAPL